MVTLAQCMCSSGPHLSAFSVSILSCTLYMSWPTWQKEEEEAGAAVSTGGAACLRH
jgi:hypothetical protein